MRVLASGIILYILIFSGISLWKYSQLRYNARDLAIYNQVTWQLSNKGSILRQAQGDNIVIPKTDKLINRITDKLYSSIQGHNYLGDHFEPILFLIAPLYALFPDPRMLLVLQTLALALAAWPLFLISQKVIKSQSHRVDESENQKTDKPITEKLKNWLPTAVGTLWLLHPAVQNANLFEFHSLSFAPLFLFFLFYYWQKIKESKTDKLRTDRLNNCTLFTLFLLLSLSVREDVSLITLFLGFIWLGASLKVRVGGGGTLRSPSGHGVPPRGTSEGEAEHGRLTGAADACYPHRQPAANLWVPSFIICLSAAWFFLAQRIISHFSPSLGYQFRIYYEWIPQLGSLGAVTKGVIAHILSFQNLEMLLGLLLPLIFLPLLKPKWLLLALPPLAAITLSSAGGGALIWQTHYGLLLLPGIFLAFIPFLTTYTPHAQFEKKHSFVYSTIVVYANEFLKDKTILLVCVMTAAVGSMLSFGPLIPAAYAISAHTNVTPQKEILASIPPHATVASTDQFLAPLSSRRGLTLLPLTLLGVQQYAAAPYPPAAYPDYLVLDEMDVKADLVQAHSIAWTQPYAALMKARFRQLLDEGGYSLMQQEGTSALFFRSEIKKPKKNPPFSFEIEDFTNVRGGLELDRLGSVNLVVDNWLR
ncbi:MAG: DUF2079 domain-containing protein [Patescibacteria group bacterium]